MKIIDDSELLEMLGDSENAKKSEAAGVAFIEKMQDYCCRERDIAERTRVLWFAKCRLAAKQHLHFIIPQALAMIDCELEILRIEMEHPECLIVTCEPLALWGGKTADLIEYIIGPQAAGVFRHPNGFPMTYKEVVRLFDKIFGKTISNPFDQRAKILDRQKNTIFQDSMRQSFLSEASLRAQ